jgi:hypothetical protein
MNYAQKHAMELLLQVLGVTVDMRVSGVPTDGVTGKGVAQVGATYIDTATGEHYTNKGTTAAPVWKKVTTA